MKTTENTIKEQPQERDLHETFIYLQDRLERALIPFILIGPLAEKLHRYEDARLMGTELVVAIKKKHLTESGLSILKMVLPELEEHEGSITFTHDDVPVTMKILKEDYEFLKYPDTRNYVLSTVMIPNPIKSYLAYEGELE